MEEMSLAGVPIVFKGAMVLNLVLHEKNPTGIVRATRDIDGDWYGKQPSMEQIENCLKEAVKRVSPELEVYAVREFGEKRSAGFRISNEKGEKVASIDLSIRNNGPVDKLKNYDLLYGIIIISISGGHSYDGEAGQPDSDGYIRHRLDCSTRPSFETD